MDLTTILGLVCAAIGLSVSVALEGGHAGSFINIPAALVVFGGTTGAVVTATPMSLLLKIPMVIKQAILPGKLPVPQTMIQNLVDLSRRARREGLLGLEPEIAKIEDHFLKNGLQLVVDGTDGEVLGDVPQMKFHLDESLVASSDDTVSDETRLDETPSDASPSTRERAAQQGDSLCVDFDGTIAGQVRPTWSSLEATGRVNGQSHQTPTGPDDRKPVGRPRCASFDTFICGQGSRLALASARTAALQPGHLSPLTVHGKTSVGKTHLLEAVCSEARKALTGKATSLYMTAEQFTTRYVEAVRGTGLPNFRMMYRDVHVLAIDDLHYLSGRRGTQIELVHLIDTFLRDGRQLVFSTARCPAQLDLAPELVTRLDGGVVCEMFSPDHPTRLEIVGQLARRMALSVPREVLALIASRLTSHTRELSGALCRLRATSEATGAPIDLAMAQTSLADMLGQGSRSVRLDDIEKAVCDVFGVDGALLRSMKRVRKLSYPRMLAMWLARKHTRAALSEICSHFGRRSHTTVLSAEKRVDKWMVGGECLDLCGDLCDVDEAIRRVERQLLAG